MPAVREMNTSGFKYFRIEVMGGGGEGGEGGRGREGWRGQGGGGGEFCNIYVNGFFFFSGCQHTG